MVSAVWATSVQNDAKCVCDTLETHRRVTQLVPLESFDFETSKLPALAKLWLKLGANQAYQALYLPFDSHL